MVRTCLHALILVASAFLAAGCGRDDLPVVLLLEDSWSEEEASLIQKAILQWNFVASQKLKSRLEPFIYGGRAAERFDVNKLADDQHVIYRLDESSADIRYVEKIYNLELSGYATSTDVLIAPFRIDEYVARKKIEVPLTEDMAHAWRNNRLEYFALHDLGHFLRLSHYENFAGVMNSDSGLHIRLTNADVNAFCLLYDCDNSVAGKPFY